MRESEVIRLLVISQRATLDWGCTSPNQEPGRLSRSPMCMAGGWPLSCLPLPLQVHWLRTRWKKQQLRLKPVSVMGCQHCSQRCNSLCHNASLLPLLFDKIALGKNMEYLMSLALFGKTANLEAGIATQ